MNNMSIQNITPSEWEMMNKQADAALRSGFLPNHIKNVAQAITIIMKGRELGIPAMQALSNIAVINGKPVANAQLMLALIYRDHGGAAIHITESTDESCTITYRRSDDLSTAGRHAYSFTMEMARKAGLGGNDVWRKYPAAMLRARCISAVALMAFPDSVGGMHTPEEMGGEPSQEDLPQDAVVERGDRQVVYAPDPNKIVRAGPVRVPEGPIDPPYDPDEELFGEEPTSHIMREQAEKSEHANWFKFQSWASKRLLTKLGCAPPLVNDVVNALYDEAVLKGATNDEAHLKVLSNDIAGLKTSGEASLYLGTINKRIQAVESVEATA